MLEGGCALTPGLRDRLQAELQRISLTPVDIKMAKTPEDVRNSAYMGAYQLCKFGIENGSDDEGYVPYSKFESDPDVAVREVVGR